jgi:putative transposase
MTKKQGTTGVIDVKALLDADGDYLRAMVRAIVEATLEAEMTAALGAEKGERTEARLGYRSGYYPRALITRVGTLELRVPQDRDGRFSTRLFERYQRSEKALVGALAEMYVRGVSTRKVKAITEELCGHAFSASAISEINKTLDAELAAFAGRRLGEALPVPDPRRALRAGARSGRDPLPGGVDRDRYRLGGAAQRARGRAGQP